MLDEKRYLFGGLEEKLGDFFNRWPISPNQWTLISLAAGLVSVYLVIIQSFIWAVFLFLIAAFADFINGIIARRRDNYTRAFRYFDTMADRYVDGLILFGMLFLPLPVIYLPGYVWLFLILFGSLVTAFAKAAAKEKEMVIVELKGGIVTRAERIILISLALLLATIDTTFVWTTYVLIFLAVITNFTAFQRIDSAVKADKKSRA